MKFIGKVAIMQSLWLVLFFHSFICTAQSYRDYSAKQDSAIRSCIDQLKTQDIDTICIYRQYCVGCAISADPFDKTCRHQPYESNTYFFWKHQGNTYFTSRDICFNYDTVQIIGHKLWSMYLAGRKKLSKQKIKSFQFLSKEKGKRVIMTTVIDHSGREDMIFIIGKANGNFYLDDYQFEKYEDNIGTNINYTYNWNTSLKKLEGMLDEIVHINWHKLHKLKY